ncbi:PTS glucose transporter subunit IIA [Mycoplasma sp. Ms02]|uniref:PTS sugar transporter subunit IIA n=1 Tax=Mycoplasma sp. Ms02 TaxID=353851 RepID=UPI001C8A43FD|nr:PTS glucose transporter subunit IIA [Mycoplasma sp. Ms02]QZE12349.1 PTS glucose transporter subunit IIA [Mycoplasma sp. Ms02]
MWFFKKKANSACGCASKNEAQQEKQVEVKKEVAQPTEMCIKLAQAFGGVNNILGFNCSVTKLRYDVKDSSLVNVEELKALGAKEVNVLSARFVEVVFGAQAEEINTTFRKSATALKAEAGDQSQSAAKTEAKVEAKEEVAHAKSLDLVSPVSGKLVDSKELGDEVFANEMLGKQLVIDVKGQKEVTVHSPISGRVIVAFPSKHAYGIKAANGAEVLVNLGINTVKLGGLPFESFVNLNDVVEAGQALVKVNVKEVEAAKLNPNVALVVTSDSALQNLSEVANEAKAGEKLAHLS